MAPELYIIMDYMQNEILIPRSVYDALSAPDEVSIIFRKRDAMLGITEKFICDDPYWNSNAKRLKSLWNDFWDEAAGYYRVKNECLLRALSKYIPGFIVNGIYTVNGNKADKTNAVLFDLTQAERLT
ncbi:MAG: hypothetical protein K5756_06200 [Clostridiales bacterium]|nr:hypothetical protein [Clostridiales bacterium]